MTPSTTRSPNAGPRLGPPRRRTIKSPKAATAAACNALEQLPNIGPSLAARLRAVGFVHPVQLVGADAHAIYLAMCRHAGRREDPCVLDSLLAAVDFMSGAAAAPWWHYTARRKALHGEL